MPTTAPSPDLARAARLFHALSDETRLGILEMLRDGEQCVCDLTDALDAAQSRLSFHLKVLKEAGLVTDRREGRWSFYEIDPTALEELETIVGAMRPPLVQLTRAKAMQGSASRVDSGDGGVRGTSTTGGRTGASARATSTKGSARGCCR